MAEPIGVASGLLALATFAFQSSIALYQTVQSFQFHPKRVRDLEEELEALSGVLGSLTETVSATTDCSTLEANAEPPVRLDVPRDHHEGEAAPRRLPIRYCEISSNPWVSEDGREGLVTSGGDGSPKTSSN
ncbi:hypothetical protein V8E51_002765 [Hyaloscypha variabilis]